MLDEVGVGRARGGDGEFLVAVLEVRGRGGARGVAVEDVHVRDAASVGLVLVQLRQQRRAPRLQLRVAPRRRPRAPLAITYKR